MTLFLWDASNYDWSRGPMDLRAAYNDGIRGFTHKATEGTRFVHDKVGLAMQRARDAGVPFLGTYIVPRTPGNNGNGAVDEQVTYFLAYMNSQVPWWKDFPGWFWQVDTEIWSNANGVYDKVSPVTGEQVCEALRQRTGRQVIHYAPKWAYGDSIPGTTPLWASNYVSGSGVSYKNLYPGDDSSRWVAYSGRIPTILQFTSKAVIGSQSTCDANAFRGTEADFAKLIGAKSIPTTRRSKSMFMIKTQADNAVYLTNGEGRAHVSPAEFAALNTAGIPLAVVSGWDEIVHLTEFAKVTPTVLTDAEVQALTDAVVAAVSAKVNLSLSEQELADIAVEVAAELSSRLAQ